MNLNMYAGAFLGTVFVVMTVGIASDSIFYSPAPEAPGFAIAVLDDPGGAEPVEDEGLQPITPLLASADIEAGAGVFRKCQACHVVEPGGANRTGPNLWNIVNLPAASHSDFRYSTAMEEYAAEGKIWDFEALNRFLAAPDEYIDGTSMGFAGLNRENERRDIIAWLAQQADTPFPLPTPEEAAAMEAAAEAEVEVEVDVEAPAEGEAPVDDMPAEEDEAAPAE